MPIFDSISKIPGILNKAYDDHVHPQVMKAVNAVGLGDKPLPDGHPEARWETVAKPGGGTISQRLPDTPHNDALYRTVGKGGISALTLGALGAVLAGSANNRVAPLSARSSVKVPLTENEQPVTAATGENIMGTTYRVPMEMDEFIDLVIDRLNWWSEGNRLRKAAESLYDEFLGYTKRCFDPATNFFKEGEIPTIYEWVDNWVANAEFWWRKDCEETYQSVGVWDDASWERYCNEQGFVFNSECAFRYLAE